MQPKVYFTCTHTCTIVDAVSPIKYLFYFYILFYTSWQQSNWSLLMRFSASFRSVCIMWNWLRTYVMSSVTTLGCDMNKGFILLWLILRRDSKYDKKGRYRDTWWLDTLFVYICIHRKEEILRMYSRTKEEKCLWKNTLVSESIGNAWVSEGGGWVGSLARGMSSHPVKYSVMTLGMMLLLIQRVPLSHSAWEN